MPRCTHTSGRCQYPLHLGFFVTFVRFDDFSRCCICCLSHFRRFYIELCSPCRANNQKSSLQTPARYFSTRFISSFTLSSLPHTNVMSARMVHAQLLRGQVGRLERIPLARLLVKKPPSLILAPVRVTSVSDCQVISSSCALPCSRMCYGMNCACTSPLYSSCATKRGGGKKREWQKEGDGLAHHDR